MNENVKRVMSQVFGLPLESIPDDASPETVGCWNSLGHLNLVMALEDEFGVRFTGDQIPDLTSFAAITEAIAKGRSDKGFH